jgi:hypothetical protein
MASAHSKVTERLYGTQLRKWGPSESYLIKYTTHGLTCRTSNIDPTISGEFPHKERPKHNKNIPGIGFYDDRVVDLKYGF